MVDLHKAVLADLNASIKKYFGCESGVSRAKVQLLDGRKLLLERPPKEENDLSEDTALPRARERSTMEQAIVDVLQEAAGPMKARTIAMQAGKSYESSGFRQAMAALKSDGVVIQPDPEEFRFWLAARENPEK